MDAGTSISRLITRLRQEGPFADRAAAGATLLIGLLFIALDLVGLWTVVAVVDLDGNQKWWHVVPLLIGTVLMLIKRRRPLIALGAGLLVFTADLLMGGSLAMVLVLFDLIYSAGFHSSRRVRQWLAVTAGVLVAVLSIVTGILIGDPRAAVMMVLQTGTVFIIPLWWAADVRNRAELATMAAERADLERARAASLRQIAALETEEAVQEERAAMARDLHDVIASHLSATAIHSAAALAAAPDPVRDREALASVRASSLAALEEMRSMIKLLRSGPGEPAISPPGIGQLDEVIDDARDHGLEVKLACEELDLPAAVGQATYRIVQEGLHNAVKHAPGSRVDLTLAADGDRLRITMINNLTQPKDSQPGLGSGTGLWSMRERTAALGGHLDAGIRDGSWSVRAEIPLDLMEGRR